MKQILIILCLLWGTVQAQTIGYLRYDSVKIAKPGGNAELIIENATKAVTGGVLTNTGNGRSAWVAGGGVVVSDSAWSLTGNAGLTAGTNFVGTTDNVDLVLKSNGDENTRITPAGKVTVIDAAGKAQMSLDPTNLLWQFGDYNGDFGNATSIHISDSNGTIRMDANVIVEALNNEDPTAGLYEEFPMFWNQNTRYLTAGTGVDSIWRFDADSIRFRVRSPYVGRYGTFGIYAPTTSSTPTWQQTLTAGSTLTGDNTVNAGNFDFTLEDADELNLIASGVTANVQLTSTNGGNASYLFVKPDSILIQPHTGNLHIDTLAYSDAADDSMMVWSAANGGAVGMRAIPSGGSGANTALSNLASVAINTSLISDANNTDDLGSASLMWRTAYMGTSAFVPLVIGGDDTTDDLIFKTTTGAGTTGSFMDFLVGNNGAIRAMRINDVGGVGILAPTTIDANHGITIKSPTNTGSHGLKILALNETVNMQIGWGIIEGSSTMRITAAGGAISLNSTSGVFVGGTSAPVATAIMESSSTTKGWLPPRMTTTQKNAISSPATGLMVYDTTLNKLCVYTGSAWETITSL